MYFWKFPLRASTPRTTLTPHPLSTLFLLSIAVMFKTFKRIAGSFKSRLALKKSRRGPIIPHFQITQLPETYEEYVQLQQSKQPTIQKRGTFSITPSLEKFLDYKASVESILDDAQNEYIEEFIGMSELLKEPEDRPYTVAEFFSFHEGNLDYLLAPFIADQEELVYGAYSILADL